MTPSRIDAALDALEGLSVGDAFGERFFAPAMEQMLAGRRLPDPPWAWTDDTNMACSVTAVLRVEGEVDQDALALSFARHYEPGRGYGAAMHGALAEIGKGRHWSEVAGSLFGGEGSYGNGAAMRVAPVGAFFADDLEAATEQARRSAAVTHAHPEAAAGAVAVAVAAALAVGSRGGDRPGPPDFIREVRDHVPDSDVAARLGTAASLPGTTSVEEAVLVLGNGSYVSCQDTVPFALWCAAWNLDDYPAALWRTVSGLGDRDTTCAIAGGVVGSRMGREGLPLFWREAREPLPQWATM